MSMVAGVPASEILTMTPFSCTWFATPGGPPIGRVAIFQLAIPEMESAPSNRQGRRLRMLAPVTLMEPSHVAPVLSPTPSITRNPRAGGAGIGGSGVGLWGKSSLLPPNVSSVKDTSNRNRYRTGYFTLGGYLSNDFLTMSSSLPSTLDASLFSSRAMARHTKERALGSRRSITSVPSVKGTLTICVPQPRQPAG